MTYVKVSLPKIKTGAGAPVPKKPNVKVYRASDVNVFPGRNGVVATGNFTLKEGAKGIAIYLTPRSINRADSTDGDPQDEMAGWIATVGGNRPGDDKHASGWLQEDLNEGHILITEECGDGEGKRLHGTPCNPLYFAAEGQDNNEGKMTTLTWTQGQRTRNKSLHWTGEDPPVADDPVEGSSGSGGI
ncbi:hypothetical protein [uncultured Algoriphagus sp.]|uniref:hypothetical protein n=1 Tax=uncultured Algoriphagus sp. TaxID=417365 RepID=UPI002583C5BA|nr:hypothetical protein [uncultured Algoriphagus sp.]